MKKKSAVSVLAAAVCAAVLTGCGGNEVKIESRTDSTVTEKKNGITYDVNEEATKADKESGEEKEKKDKDKDEEKKDAEASDKEKAGREDKKDADGFVFSTGGGDESGGQEAE